MRRLWALAIVGMLVIAACGGDETPAGRSGSVPSLSEKIEEFRSVLAEEFPDLNTRGTPFTNLVESVIDECERDTDTLALTYALNKGEDIGDLILIEVEIFCPERLDELK